MLYCVVNSTRIHFNSVLYVPCYWTYNYTDFVVCRWYRTCVMVQSATTCMNIYHVYHVYCTTTFSIANLLETFAYHWKKVSTHVIYTICLYGLMCVLNFFRGQALEESPQLFGVGGHTGPAGTPDHLCGWGEYSAEQSCSGWSVLNLKLSFFWSDTSNP